MRHWLRRFIDPYHDDGFPVLRDEPLSEGYKRRAREEIRRQFDVDAQEASRIMERLARGEPRE